MVTIELDTDQWPDHLEAALRQRAKVRGVSLEDLIAEILTAFVEKREPVFTRRNVDEITEEIL